MGITKSNISAFYQNLLYFKIFRLNVCPPDTLCDVMCKGSIPLMIQPNYFTMRQVILPDLVLPGEEATYISR